MPEMLLFPRLPLRAARERLSRIKGRTAADLSAMATSTEGEAIYPATGGSRVTTGTLDEIRDQLVSEAKALGFPGQDGGGTTHFDALAASILFQHLPIAPSEACRNEVWSFMAISLLPDLTTWRFPDQNDRRFIGGVRNAFQRVWWRAYMLRDDDASDQWWLVRLPEDALVGLMERPGISSNRTVTRAIARAIAGVTRSLPAAVREDGWRLAYKRIRQRVPIVNLDTLPESELEHQLDEICRALIADIGDSTQ